MAIETPVLKLPRADFDSPWKHVIDFYFRPFVEFCLPHIAKDIDWDRGHEFLDKELLAITYDMEVGHRIADKLVKAWKKNGEEAWFLFHIEIDAGGKKKTLPQRMLVYRYRARDRFRHPIISIAILIDGDPIWRPNFYREECYGTSLEIHYQVVKLLDYKDKRQDLEAMNNPFAMVILAQLAVIETRKKPQARLQAKTALTRQLYAKGWDKEEILQLYGLIDWLITLPNELVVQYNDQVKHIEEEKQMNYITTAERVGMEKGFQEGVATTMQYVTTAERIGMEKGFQEGVATTMQYVTTAERIGIQKGEIALLIRLLKHRFSIIPVNYLQQIEQADNDRLLLWGERVLDAATLEEVFK